jgi:hypothetical protein
MAVSTFEESLRSIPCGSPAHNSSLQRTIWERGSSAALPCRNVRTIASSELTQACTAIGVRGRVVSGDRKGTQSPVRQLSAVMGPERPGPQTSPLVREGAPLQNHTFPHQGKKRKNLILGPKRNRPTDYRPYFNLNLKS